MIDVYGWYWDGADNFGEYSYRHFFSEYASFKGLRLRFTINSEEIARHSRVLVGGGELLSSAWEEGLHRLALRAKLLIGLSVSGDSYNACHILRACEKLWVRDYITYEIAKRVGCNVEYAPDIAILWNGNPSKGRALAQQWFVQDNLEPPEKYLLVIPLGYWTRCRIDEYSIKTYVDVVQQCPMPVVLAAASRRDPDDRAACYLIKEWANRWGKTVVAESCHLPDIIAGAAGVVTSRLHVAIVAIACEKPVVVWSDHVKILGAMEAMGYAQCRLPHTASGKEILERLFTQSPPSANELKKAAYQSLVDAFAYFQ